MPSPLPVSRDFNRVQHGKVLTCSTKSIAVDFGHAKSHRDLWTAFTFSEISTINPLPYTWHLLSYRLQSLLAVPPDLPLQIIFIQSHEPKTRTRIRNTSQ